MFCGRDAQLKKLNSIFNSSKFECVIMHGRLRVGKTAILREFIKGKPAIYFAAQETDERYNMVSLTRSVNSHSGGAFSTATHAGIDEIFEHIAKLAMTNRLILVIDDYQYLVSANKDISKIICNLIDKYLKDSRLMMIICGSSAPVMATEALSYDSFFHGKRTAQIKVLPFSFFETKRHYDDFSPFDIAVIYGLTGGVPKYISLMDHELPIEENIKRTFFDSSSFLFEEPASFLRREVRDPSLYNAVLRTIASGLEKNSEIAAAVGLETSACTAYLNNLISFGIVKKHTPITEKAGKKTIYVIEDSFFRFWYRFVPDNLSNVQLGKFGMFWRKVASEIPAFMLTVFEDICREWVEQRNQSGRLPIESVEVGRWWGVNPITKESCRIPIVAYADDDNALFGDCVWQDEPADEDALLSLDERSRLFRYKHRHLFLFSRSGFSDECAAAAARIGANLVMFE